MNNNASKKRIVVVGGGITGLAATHRLLERSKELEQQLEIILLEASSGLGGVIQTESRDGFLLERGPDSFISEKPETANLARRLGIDSHLIQTNQHHRRTFIVRNGKLRRIPDGFQLLGPSRFWPFLTSDIFSFSGKLRMAAELFVPRRRFQGNGDESLASFVRRRFGTEALTRMAQPMIGGIYTADPEELSLKATLPRFLEMEALHRSVIIGLRRANKNSKDPESPGAADQGSGTSGARYGLFLSFDLGMQLLVDALQKRIAALSQADSPRRAELRVNTAVQSVESLEDGSAWVLKTNQNELLSADGLCLAVPAPAAAKLVSNVAPALAQELAAIPYVSTATINLAFRCDHISHPLNGFGFVVPYIEKRSLLACTFSSIKFPARAPEGFALLRAFVGGALQPEMFDLEPADMVQRVVADLDDLLGVAKPPLFSNVSKWKSSMPQYRVGHLARVGRIEAELKKLSSLKIAGNGYNGVGISDCIRSGETVADALLSPAAPPPITSAIDSAARDY